MCLTAAPRWLLTLSVKQGSTLSKELLETCSYNQRDGVSPGECAGTGE